MLNIQDVFTLIPAAEIRALREEAPANLATLCNKAVDKIIKAVDNSCRTQQEQQTGNLKCLYVCENCEVNFYIKYMKNPISNLFFLCWNKNYLYK